MLKNLSLRWKPDWSISILKWMQTKDILEWLNLAIVECGRAVDKKQEERGLWRCTLAQWGIHSRGSDCTSMGKSLSREEEVDRLCVQFLKKKKEQLPKNSLSRHHFSLSDSGEWRRVLLLLDESNSSGRDGVNTLKWLFVAQWRALEALAVIMVVCVAPHSLKWMHDDYRKLLGSWYGRQRPFTRFTYILQAVWKLVQHWCSCWKLYTKTFPLIPVDFLDSAMLYHFCSSLR